jgi:hypothetical protein
MMYPHPGYIGCLPGDVHLAHVDDALQPDECTDGSGSYAVLSCSGFGNDPFFTQALRDQYLTDGIIDLMGAGMVQVFPLQVNIGTVMLAQPFSKIERAWPADVVFQQRIEFFFKLRVRRHGPVSIFQLLNVGVQHFRDIGSAKPAVVASFVDVYLEVLGHDF